MLHYIGGKPWGQVLNYKILNLRVYGTTDQVSPFNRLSFSERNFLHFTERRNLSVGIERLNKRMGDRSLSGFMSVLQLTVEI